MDKLANTVIKKINNEAEQLTAANGDRSKMQEAMRNINLLSELWLESNVDGIPERKQPTKNTAVQPADLRNNDSKGMSVNNDDTSIFDF